MSSSVRSQIQNILGIQDAIGDVKYVGHNLFLQRQKCKEFKKVIDNLILETNS